MKLQINRLSDFPFGNTILQLKQVSFQSSKKATLIVMTTLVICLTGCNISNDDGSFTENVQTDLEASEVIFSNVGPSGKCPVVTGQDVAGVVAPMFHPHVLNVQLRKAEGLLLPAVQAVQGHFRIKLCETLTENYQFEWNLRVNNKEGLGFTGWTLLNRENEEELIGVQFPNKGQDGRQVRNSGILEVDGEFISAPENFLIVVRTTTNEVNLVGLLLPAVQAGKN